MQQAPAKRSKGRHNMKAKQPRSLLDETRDPASESNEPQRAAKSGYRFLFRLLTGGLLVRVQPEEPIFSCEITGQR
jgi:hypothetical protein